MSGISYSERTGRTANETREHYKLPAVLPVADFEVMGYHVGEDGKVWLGFLQGNEWGADIVAARVIVEGDRINLALRGNLVGLEAPARIPGDVPVVSILEWEKTNGRLPVSINMSGWLVELPFRPSELSLLKTLT